MNMESLINQNLYNQGNQANQPPREMINLIPYIN